jgi:hypothetical protein
MRLERGRALRDRPPLPPWASALAGALCACPTPVVTRHPPCHAPFIGGRPRGGGRLRGRVALACPGPPPRACRLPVPGISTPRGPSPRSGLQRGPNTRLTPVRPSVSVPGAVARQGGVLVRPGGLRLVAVSLRRRGRLLTSPLGSGARTLPSARSDGPQEPARGQTPRVPHVGAGLLTHAPIAAGGRRGHGPPRPARATPPLPFLGVAPRVWLGRPSAPASRRRPGPAPRLRLRKHLARGRAPRAFCAMPGTHAQV